MKWIRLRGLAAFVIAAVVIAAGWFLFVDVAVRCMIERTGTRLVGAKVELDDADLRFFPAGLVLSGLRITNPDEPMKNAVEAARISFLIDGPNLLRRKVIVEEMEAGGVRLNTRRETSGAVSAGKAGMPSAKKEAAEKRLMLPSFKMPDIEDILNNEKLASLARIESFRGEIKGNMDEWRRRLDGLLNKEKIEEYRKRFKKLEGAKGGDIGAILGGAGELVSLQKELKKDMDGLKAAGVELDGLINSYERRLKEVAQAPGDDVKRLLRKYSVSPEGLKNASRLLFGARVEGWVGRALNWYERLKPMMERAGERSQGKRVVKPMRGKGEYVRFKEERPIPDLLIRKATVFVDIPAGLIKGEIKNITPDQDVLGSPMTFSFTGERLKGLQSLRLTGKLDHVRPERSENKARFVVSGYRLKDFDLGGFEDLGVIIEDSLADLTADLSLKSKDLKAGIDVVLGSLKVSRAGAEGRGAVASALSGAFSSIGELNIRADISGTIDDYGVKVSSDLDRIIGKALEVVVKEQSAALRGELEKRVADAVDAPMAGLKDDMAGIKGLKVELDGLLNDGGGLLKGGGKGGLPGNIKLPF